MRKTNTLKTSLDKTKKNEIIKKIVPHITAIAVFVLMVLIYFAPLLQGKSHKATDTQQAKGWSKELVDHYQKTGKYALWTNSMYGGMPSYQIWYAFPETILTYPFMFLKAFFSYPANLVFLYLIGCYLLLITLSASPLLSFIGSCAFSFSSYNFILIEAGHYNKALAIGYMLFAFSGIIITFRKSLIWGGLLSAAGFSFGFQANHVQIVYYFGIFFLFLGAVEFVQAVLKKQVLKFLKIVGVLIIAIVIAIFDNASSLWTTYVYSKQTTRGVSELKDEKGQQLSGLSRDAAFMWSYGIAETMTFIVPNFYGGSSKEKLSTKSETFNVLKNNGIPNAKEIVQNIPLYWGTQPFTSGPAYMGAIVCFLFLLGLLIVNEPMRWWTLGTFLLTTALAWGSNFPLLSNLFYDYFPLYNKFRSITMIHVITSLSMVLLGIEALKKIIYNEVSVKKINTSLNISAAIAGSVCLIFLILPGAFLDFVGRIDSEQLKEWPDWLIKALREDRKSLLQSDALRSLIFVAATFGIICAVVRNKIRLNYALCIISLLVLIDMWSVSKRYLNDDDFLKAKQVAEPFQPTLADQMILKDTTLSYRVFDFTDPSFFSNARTSYFHKSVGGYHPAKLGRYDDLINKQIATNNFTVLNMLNTKYFIAQPQGQQGGYPVAHINPNALGNAWFVEAYQIVEDPNEEMKALSNFDPAKIVYVDKRFSGYLNSLKISKDPSSQITLTVYEPDYLMYESKTITEQLAVFSEIYYDDKEGWQVYVDDNPVTHIRGNYLLRVMKIPAGKHKIEFRFEPQSLAIGGNLANTASAVFLGLFIFGIYREVWERKNKAD